MILLDRIAHDCAAALTSFAEKRNPKRALGMVVESNSWGAALAPVGAGNNRRQTSETVAQEPPFREPH